MNEPWAIESILNGTGGGGGGGNPIPPITNIYVPVEEWKYQDRIIDVVGFPWVADVPYPNVKASDFVSVIFGQEDAESGIFSNVCESRTDAVRIFASEKPTKRIRIDTLSGFRPNASNSIWGHITGEILEQQDLVDFVGDSNKIESIKANGTALAITDKAVNIPLATNSTAGLKYNSDSCIVVYVSPNGSDTTGDGSQSKPWREIQTALENTSNLGYEWVRVECSAGTYEKPIFTGFNYPNCVIYANGDITTPAMEFNQNCGKVILVGSTSTTNINVITTGEHGIILAYGCSLLKQGDCILNVTASLQGIRIGGQTSKINSPFKWYIQSFELMGTTNITITNSSGTYGGISVYYPTTRLCIDTLNVDNPNGVGIRLINESQICTVNQLTCNGTPYSLGFGSVLFIGGKLVNQYDTQTIVYVSPDGDDTTGDGTYSKPWREIQTAIEKSDWYPIDVISIQVAPGDYYNQVYFKSHRHTYHIVLSGDATLHNNMIISSCLVCIDSISTGMSFNIDTTEDYGICLYFGGTLNQRIQYINIVCPSVGIYSGGATGVGTWKTGGINNLLMAEVSITLTNPHSQGIRTPFRTGHMYFGKLTVNGISGEALRLTASLVCCCKELITNLTEYTVSGGAMLSIAGQWVNQSTEGE